MGDGERCSEAARAAGFTESHAESCEGRAYGCAGCPFAEPRTLREVHDASCREDGMSEAEVEADWADFEVEYDAVLAERRAREDAEDPRFVADAGRDEGPWDLEGGSGQRKKNCEKSDFPY